MLGSHPDQSPLRVSFKISNENPCPLSKMVPKYHWLDQPRFQSSSAISDVTSLVKLFGKIHLERLAKNGKKDPDQREKVPDNFSTKTSVFYDNHGIFRTYEINTSLPSICEPCYRIATKCGGRFFPINYRIWLKLWLGAAILDLPLFAWPRAIALGSKPPLVTRIARTGLGTRLPLPVWFFFRLSFNLGNNFYFKYACWWTL